MKLDRDLRDLLRDTELSILKSKQRRHPPAELAATPISEEDAEAWEGYALEGEEGDESASEAWHNRSQKLSPEASFGSKRIGSIDVPLHLDRGMAALIDGA